MRSGMFREPDLMYVERKHFKWIGEKYVSGSDLVMEVVSPDPASVDRDYEKKRVDFAEGKIREYWIVDPQDKRVTVLTLDEKKYRVHGEFIVGEQATSILLDGFAVNVADVFAAATLS
jgi:Uma2 family endonuclease